jgi:uncharacterized protein involved in exopolysaccharide biosynthesis
MYERGTSTQKNEVDVGNVEATDVKIDALRAGLDEVKRDVRELRAEMHAGFAALRESIATLQANTQSSIATLQASTQSSIATLQASVAGLQGMMKATFWAIGVLGMVATVFFTAGKALHWF